MSEHRKSLEKGNADANLIEIQRRLRSLRKQNDARDRPAKVGGGQARSSTEAANPRRAKGPEFKGNDQRRDKQEIGRGLLTPRSVWELQQSLHAKVGMSTLVRKPDAGDPHVRFDERERGNGAWLKYCGTGGKPAGKRRKQTST